MAKSKNSKSSKNTIPSTETTANRLAQEQAKLNALSGQVNEVTPFGTATYTTGPDGRVTRTSTLSAAEQAKLDQANALDSSIQGLASMFANQGASTYASPFAGDSKALADRRRAVEDQTFGAFESRLNPYWERQRNTMEASLANRGIAPGSRGYATAMGDFSQQQNDAYLQAQNTAFGAGRQEADTLFNQDLTRYQMPMQMLTGLRGAVSGVNAPNFLQPNMQAPDFLGAATALYGQKNQKDIAGKVSGGGGGGGTTTSAPITGGTTVAGISDPRTKSRSTGLVGLGRLSAGY